MSDRVKRYLEQLEPLIDLSHVEKTRALHADTFAHIPVDRIPVVINYGIPAEEWPSFGYRAIFSDPEAMLLSELAPVYAGAKLKDDRNFGIRTNYGTGIIASVFGCPIRVFDRVLPCAEKAIGIEKARQLIADGIPDINTGLCAKAFETLEYFRENLRDYPNIRSSVGSMMLDIQGPFDNASILLGSEVYYQFSDDPLLLDELLRLIVDVTVRVTRKYRSIDGSSPKEDAEMFAGIGGALIRNDSTINIGKEHYEEHIRRHDQELLREFTGSIHFCGKAGHLIGSMLELDGLIAINPFQGQFYDLPDLFRACESKGKSIFNWTTAITEEARDLIKTGFTYSRSARTFDDARRLLEDSYRTGWA